MKSAPIFKRLEKHDLNGLRGDTNGSPYNGRQGDMRGGCFMKLNNGGSHKSYKQHNPDYHRNSIKYIPYIIYELLFPFYEQLFRKHSFWGV